jgi:hypothetical protein
VRGRGKGKAKETSTRELPATAKKRKLVSIIDDTEDNAGEVLFFELKILD